MPRELIIILEFGGVKIDISARFVCIAVLKQLFDKFYVFGNAVRRRFNNIGSFDVQLAAIVKERILIEFCKLHNGFALALRTGDHLVFAGVTVA